MWFRSTTGLNFLESFTEARNHLFDDLCFEPDKLTFQRSKHHKDGVHRAQHKKILESRKESLTTSTRLVVSAPQNLMKAKLWEVLSFLLVLVFIGLCAYSAWTDNTPNEEPFDRYGYF